MGSLRSQYHSAMGKYAFWSLINYDILNEIKENAADAFQGDFKIFECLNSKVMRIGKVSESLPYSKECIA